MLGAPGGPVSGAGGSPVGAGGPVGAGAPVVAPPSPQGIGSFFKDLFPSLTGALKDPDSMAKLMAEQGITPEQFKRDAARESKLAETMRIRQEYAGSGRAAPTLTELLMGRTGAEIGTAQPVGPEDTIGPSMGQRVQPARPEVAPQMQTLGQLIGGEPVPPQPSTPGQLPINPPIVPQAGQVPAVMPSALGQVLRPDTRLQEAAYRPKSTAVQPTEGTYAPPQIQQLTDRIRGTTYPEARIGGGTTPEGSLMGGSLGREGALVGGTTPEGTELDSTLPESYLKPTREITTPYKLHGGATRADAIMGFDPKFNDALTRMYEAAPPEVQKELGLTSAYRSYETQKELFEKSDKSGKNVAPPGESRHNYGFAADLSGFGLREGGPRVSDTTRQWVHANAKNFGLSFPLGHEPWHVEMMGEGGERVALPMVPDEIAQRGAIPQLGLQQREPSARMAMFQARGLKPEYRQWMGEIGQSYGVDPNYLQVVALLESGGNPDAHNPSGADGMFQFMPGTAKQYRVTNTRDPKDSIRGASELAMDNAKALEKELGRKPTWAEVYLAHQQGSKGAAVLLKNPNEMAVNLVGREEVIGNGGTSGMTAQEFANLWIDKYNGKAKEAGGKGDEGNTSVDVPVPGERPGSTDVTTTTTSTEKETPKTPREKAAATLASISEAMKDYDASKDQIAPPAAVAPRSGEYQPNKEAIQLMMLLLGAGGGGKGIPTISQLMSGA